MYLLIVLTKVQHQGLNICICVTMFCSISIVLSITQFLPAILMITDLITIGKTNLYLVKRKQNF